MLRFTDPDAAPALQTVRDDSSDAELLMQSLLKPERFDRIYSRHHSAVFRYVAARVGSAAAEDVVSETFLAAFSVRKRFNAARGDNALPWLLGIATRRLGRHRDRERRWIRDRAGAVGETAREADEALVTERVDAQRLVPRLAAALEQLSVRERDPLLLHVLAGLSYEEISAALRLPVGTVRSRISRARTRLAGMMDGAPR